MSIKILFFGATADIVGNCEVSIEYAAISVSQLIEQTIADHPRLAGQKLLISVNQQYANGDEMIGDGDEIAIFTAVSGG